MEEEEREGRGGGRTDEKGGGGGVRFQDGGVSLPHGADSRCLWARSVTGY